MPAAPSSISPTGWPTARNAIASSRPPSPASSAHLTCASPTTSESKEAIADYDEIRKEIKLALQECGRKLSAYVNRRRRAQYEGRRREVFDRYIGEVVAGHESSGMICIPWLVAIGRRPELESLDLDVLYRAARYDKGEADYLNAPLDREQYQASTLQWNPGNSGAVYNNVLSGGVVTTIFTDGFESGDTSAWSDTVP